MKKQNIEKLFALIVALLALALFVSIGIQAVDLLGGGSVSTGITPCAHTNTTLYYEKANAVNHEVKRVCSSCKATVSSFLTSHDWKDDTCTQCFEKCGHTVKTVSYVSNNDGTHRLIEVCRYCRMTISTSTSVCDMSGAVCKQCGYGCAHTNTATVDGATVCNDCGKTIDAIYVCWGRGAAEKATLKVVEGQTWMEVLACNDSVINSHYGIEIMATTRGPESYPIYLTSDGGVDRYQILCEADGKWIDNRTDKPEIGATYYGWDINYGQYSTVFATNWSNGNQRAFEYIAGWTWGDLVKYDIRSELRDVFKDAGTYIWLHEGNEGYIYCNGKRVTAADVIDPNASYVYVSRTGVSDYEQTLS